MRPTKGLLMHSSSTDHVVNGRVGVIGDKLLSFSTYTIVYARCDIVVNPSFPLTHVYRHSPWVSCKPEKISPGR